jgi:hypothetical protein
VPDTVGLVPLEGRGDLPFLTLHGEPLLLHAVRAVTGVPLLTARVVVSVDPAQRDRAEHALGPAFPAVEVVEPGPWWRGTDPAGTGLRRLTVLVHDPLCPLTPSGFLGQCLAECLDPDTGHAGAVGVVAIRPVTDTLKTVVDDRIVGTLDRDRFATVASPVVWSRRAGDGDEPPVADFAALAAWVRARGTVRLREAPPIGRRVDDRSAVDLLECMAEIAGDVRGR